MAAIRRRLDRAWRAVAQLAESRRAPPLLFVLALGTYGLVSVAEPVRPGRDLGRYLLLYAELFEPAVAFPYALASRTPGTALVVGPLLEAGPLVAEAGAAALFALSVVAWFAVARRLGTAVAVATALALLLYPGYVLLFHRLSSDAVFAFAFALVALLLARAVERASPGRMAALGLGVAALVLVRPVAQALLLLVVLPLVAPAGWRARIRATAAFSLAALVPLVGWAAHNGVRADDWTLQRGGGATFPLFRAFVADRIVDPENGTASREVARAVARDLLPNEPYRSYRIDLQEFFGSGSARMHEDLIGLSDRVWGWDDDYARLARMGREAVTANPGAYAKGVARDLRRLLVWPLYAGVEAAAPRPAPPARPPRAGVPELAAPSEGEPIPSARQSAYISTPDGSIREVWTSATEHGIVFDDPAHERRAAAASREVDELLASFPDREQRPELARRLNSASRWYPRPIVWLLVGLAAALARRPRDRIVPLTLAGLGLLVLLTTSLAVYAVAEYSVPVVPAFALLAAWGLFGRREPR